MTTPPDPRDDDALAAEYALGLLSADEARAVEARLATDPDFRLEVALWQADLAQMLDGAPDVPPLPGVKAAIDRRLFPDESVSLWRRLGLLPALLGAVAAAGIAYLVAESGLLAPAAPLWQMQIAAADQSLVVQASYLADRGVIVLDRRAGDAQPGRALEVWVIAGQAAPVSLGLLGADAVTELAVAAALVPPGAVLAISDEPAGGSPTGLPTGAVLATGEVAPG